MSEHLQKLRVANVGYLNSAPYRALAKLDFVDYREFEPSECARRLHRGASDLACVPVSECFMNGAYRTLPFGIVAKGPVESVLLYSSKPVSELSTILIDESSHASVSLLRVLLPTLGFSGNRKPLLLRMPRAEIAKRIAGDIGGLIIGDLDPAMRNSFPHCLDLAQAWFESTAKPFVFAIWALRPDVISRERHQALLEAFAQAEANKVIYAREWAEEHNFDKALAVQYITERIFYPVDMNAFDGLASFYTKGRAAGIFPSVDLNFLALGVADNRASHRENENQRIEITTGPSRLSLQQAARLAETGSFADLSLSASIRAGVLASAPTLSPVHCIYFSTPNEEFRSSRFRPTPADTAVSLLPKEEVEVMLNAAIENEAIEICVKGELTPELTLDYIDELIGWITSAHTVAVSGFSSKHILTLAERSNLSVEATLQRLQIAGLSVLCDEINAESATDTAEVPLAVHQVAHRIGLKSAISFRYTENISSEEQLLVLHYLRNIQDETKGFVRVEILPALNFNMLPQGSLSGLLKFQAVAALFLDNVLLTVSSTSDNSLPLAQLSLLTGASGVSELPSPTRLGSFSPEYVARSEALVAATISGLEF